MPMGGGGKEELSRVGRSKGMSAHFQMTILSASDHACSSSGAGRVSSTRKVSPSVEREKECEDECTRAFLHFSVDHCEKVNGLREIYSFQSYSWGQIPRSWMPVCGFIHHIHPLLMGSFSQLTCG